MNRRLPHIAYNLTSLVGAVLALIALGLIAMLYLLETFSKASHPYMGLITFIVLPAFLCLGIALVLWGMFRARQRALAGTPEPPMPRIDFNNPKHRNAVVLFAFGGTMFLVLSAFGSYQAYEYTDSVQFCGLVCHKVMEPEYTAYQGSPHARVACVECHIGSGASSFVRSKISGSYQVYSVLFHKYPRPISTPVHSLRPARETCEQCHWPRHFYSAKLLSRNYYLSNPQNSKSHIDLLMKIGGGDPIGGQAGIHAHMYLDNKVSYIAVDRGRNNIPYVESTTADGKTTVYRTTENPPTDAQLAKGEHRTVDCIDCHNRPTHVFRHPAQSVNQAMGAGVISPTLPDVKRVSVEALEGTYTSRTNADRAIAKAMTDFYTASYPKIAADRQPDIQQAVLQVQNIYNHNYFPRMNANWKGFPDHIGHMYSDGCFRCHDGKHVSSDGKVISKSCTACHTLLSQSVGTGTPTISLGGVAFKHPGNVGDAWKDANCTTCHAQQQ
ncbi:MAG TPA: NapC/NirT family cytochrome c [Armatimonadota bacterium]|jgi:ribosomal protein S27E